MKFDVIKYFLKEGFKNTLKKKKSTMASVITMVCALFVFAIFILITYNVKVGMQKVERQQGMQAYIKDDTELSKIKDVQEEISKIDGVNTIKHKTKQEAYESLQDKFGNSFSYESPSFLPDSYIITLTDIGKLKSVRSEVEKLDIISEIKDQEGFVEKVERILKFINSFMISIIIVLVIVSIMIIGNTIQLTVDARKREINIMKYVGATDAFIKGPFIIEGVIISLFASLITLGIIAVFYEMIRIQLQKMTSSIQANIQILDLAGPLPILVVSFLVLSVGIGLVGSLISMREYLEV